MPQVIVIIEGNAYKHDENDGLLCTAVQTNGAPDDEGWYAVDWLLAEDQAQIGLAERMLGEVDNAA